MDLIRQIENEQITKEVPSFSTGDTVQVHYRIIQVFEGTVIKVQGEGVRQTFTVRRLSYGVGVERTFLVHSPRIAKLVVTRRGKTRRAKLFYIRDRQGKAAKVKERTNY